MKPRLWAAAHLNRSSASLAAALALTAAVAVAAAVAAAAGGFGAARMRIASAAAFCALLFAGALCVAAFRAQRRDLSRRIGTERSVLEAQRRAAIAAAQNLIAADFERTRVMELLAQQARELSGASGAAVVLDEDEAAETEVPRTRSLTAVAGDTLTTCAVAVVPLVCLGRRLGEVRIFSSGPQPFGGEVVGALQLLAGFAAAALLHAAELSAKESALHAERRAKGTADRASRAKSEFLASMSHELRTPLNSIIGFSEILHDQRFGPLNARQARHVENVLHSGQHLLQLVNDVLDLSKVESGRMELHPAPIDLHSTFSQAVASLEPQAQAKRIEIDVSLPVVEPLVVADAGKLLQVLYNLLSNAVKFTPQGGRLRVEAQALVASQPGEGVGVLLVSVADTGIGIQLRDHLRIFEAFEQIDAPLARSQPGTGLGLALCRKLVELHGGRIWVESDGPGHGSCFRFTLPLAAADRPPRQTPNRRLPRRRSRAR